MRNMSTMMRAQAIDTWAEQIEKGVRAELLTSVNQDGSHDIGHLQRVSTLGCRFAREESADELVVYAAGMLHDIVNLPKNHPEANKCSFFASLRAEELLTSWQFPKELIPEVCHVIHAHSFSANVEPRTIEAKCLQDADRMEAIGAFGLMRVFYVSGKMGAELMHEEDPAGMNRELNDRKFALDHFVLKLFKLPGIMKTGAGRKTASSLSSFLEDFRNEIINDHQKQNKSSGRFHVATVYHHAGQKNRSLFHLEDPFAEKGRALSPDIYALDNLLQIHDTYVQRFIDQLRFEFISFS